MDYHIKLNVLHGDLRSSLNQKYAIKRGELQSVYLAIYSLAKDEISNFGHQANITETKIFTDWLGEKPGSAKNGNDSCRQKFLRDCCLVLRDNMNSPDKWVGELLLFFEEAIRSDHEALKPSLLQFLQSRLMPTLLSRRESSRWPLWQEMVHIMALDKKVTHAADFSTDKFSSLDLLARKEDLSLTCFSESENAAELLRIYYGLSGIELSVEVREPFSDWPKNDHRPDYITLTPNSLGGSGKKDGYLRKWAKKNKVSASMEFLYLLNGLEKLQEGGRAVMQIRGNYLSRGGADADVREHLIRNGNIRALIKLPQFFQGGAFCMVVDKHNNSRFGDDKQVLIASIPEGMGAAEATALVGEALSSDSAKPSNPWMRFVKVDEIEEEGFLLSPSCYLPLVPNWQAVEEASLMREEVAEKRLIEIRSCDEAIRDIKSHYSNIFSNKK